MVRTFRYYANYCTARFDQFWFARMFRDRANAVFYDRQEHARDTATCASARRWKSLNSTCSGLMMGCVSVDMQFIRHRGKVYYARQLQTWF